MVIAYIMVKAATPEADRLQRSIAEIDGVVDVHIVAGDVDLIARVDVPSPADVKRIAAEHVQAIDGVESTRTYVAME